jgi:hypothetical protein
MNTQLELLGKCINMAGRAHRRWLVVATYFAFTAFIVAVFWFSGTFFYLWCLIAVVAVSMMVSHLVGRRSEATDERQSYRWDHATARAYPWIGHCLLIALVTTQLHSKVSEAAHPALFSTFQQLPYSLLMAAGVLYITLPQAILLWTEPDILEGE